MLKATVGARRVLDRLRSGLRDQGSRAANLRRPAAGVAGTRSRLAGSTHSPALAGAHPVRAANRRPLAGLGAPVRDTLARALRSERILPVSVVLLILFSSILSFAPFGGQALAVGGPEGDGEAPRIAIGGSGGPRSGGVLSDTDTGILGVPGADAALALGGGGTDLDFTAEDAGFLEDGTLLKPVAVDTSVADGRGLLTSYAVQSGDTLTGIATRFNINMMTIWWANSLTSKDALKIGQVLIIPTINGVVMTVAEGDTIEGLAEKYAIDPGQIIDVNGLEDPNLVIGQTLIMPGARGDAIPASASAPAPVRTTTRTTTTTTRTSAPTSYSGGTFRWPVIGGNNYISQYFRYGHYGLDIAADYGSSVVAAAGGSVLFSGWKSNGGGYQVWIAHGSGLYTTYNHMSALTVGTGQSVGRGQQVGRVGRTGYATGPHLHLEVWVGPIWNGGYRVNPLKYL